MWLIYAVLSAVFAGLTAILAKVGIRNVKSNLATALRTIVVLIFAWLLVFMQGSYHTIPTIGSRTLVFLILSGIATGASWLCYFRALQTGDVNKVTPIDKASTVLTILLAFAVLGERITFLKLVCVLLIGAGTYLMVCNWNKQGKTAGIRINDTLNDTSVTGKKAFPSWLVFASLSAVFASLTAILGKIGISGVDSNLGTAIRTIVVLIMSWLVVFITGEHKGIREIDGKSGIFLVLSGITTGLSWMCYYKALQEGTTSVVVSVDKLSILLTVFFSVVILKEKIGRRAVWGLVCITAGTLLLLV